MRADWIVQGLFLFECVCVVTLSCVQLFATPWTVAHQAPLSIEFFRQEYWSGFLFTTSGDLPDPGIKPTSLASLALAGGFFTVLPGKPSNHLNADLEGSYAHHYTTNAECCFGNSGGHCVDSGLLKMQIHWWKQSVWDSFMLWVTVLFQIAALCISN